MGANTPRNRRWLHHDKLERTLARRAVTVCVATLFRWNYGTLEQPQFGPAALVASDRMITAGDIVEYEPRQMKVAKITGRALILIAGDFSLHSQALIDAGKQIGGNQNATAQNIALIYSRAIQTIKQRRAEDRYLAPLGLNLDTFLAQQKDMSDSFVNRLTDQLQDYVGEEVEALVVGSHDNEIHLYAIDPRGTVNCFDDVGFAAVGIGAWHAKSRLMQAGYTNSATFARALAAIYAAKRNAEIAPGVGATTDIHLVSRNGHHPLWANISTKIQEIYDKYIQRADALTNEAIAELQTFIESEKPNEENTGGHAQANE